MEAGALILQNNSGHNVLALKKKAPQDLVALATLYDTAQVAGQARGTEEAKRHDISRFLAFYYDLTSSPTLCSPSCSSVRCPTTAPLLVRPTTCYASWSPAAAAPGMR
jgi:hypothetical protein